MFEFEKLCKDIENLDSKTWNELLVEKSDSVIDQLTMITNDEISGLTLFYGLVLGAIVSDGKIDEGEFKIIKPFLDIALKKDVTYDFVQDYVKILKPESAEYKGFIDTAVDAMGELSDQLKNDVVLLCLLICGVDSKISAKEKRWIKQLIK